MSVFNSLGSNYTWRFVWRSLTASNKKRHSEDLEKYLKAKYDGKAILLYKGREALELSLKRANLAIGSKVGITGFTCYAVYKAVLDARCKPVYLDINPDSLNFEPDKLTTDLKAVIVQNTLGIPCDIEKIVEFCKKNNIILIEDLAHCVGIKYADGKEAGTVGDFVALSFSQDKMVDSVSGGALIIRNKKYQEKLQQTFQKVSSAQQIKDRLYPLLTFLVRKTYPIGKALHVLLKSLNLLSTPMDDRYYGLYDLPNWYCSLITHAFDHLEENLNHRKKIISIYAKKFNKRLEGSLLRFPLFVKNREGLILQLKKQGVYISDIWYDAPIGPKKYLLLTDYKNQCPDAEEISRTVVNLPTHRSISEKQALFICETINQWLKSQ